MAKRTIIGIDPGTVVTGYAIVQELDNQLAVIDFGCIRPPAKERLSDRYVIIHDAVAELLQTHNPEALAIETQFVHRNPQSAIKLGMARGVVLLAARKAHIEIFEYTPKKVKVAVTGNGNASKPQVQTMVQHLLRLPTPPAPFDAADALALTICHTHAIQTPQLLGIRT